MTCRRCGKALGNQSVTCPFCGLMISATQMKEYKKDHRFDDRMVTEKFGVIPTVYEKREKSNKGLWGLFFVLGIILIILIIVLIKVLN